MIDNPGLHWYAGMKKSGYVPFQSATKPNPKKKKFKQYLAVTGPFKTKEEVQKWINENTATAFKYPPSTLTDEEAMDQAWGKFPAGMPGIEPNPVVMDLVSATRLVEELNNPTAWNRIGPYVNAYVSTLGGSERPSVLVTVSLDPKEEWHNGILENSTYGKYHIGHDGVIESISGPLRIRKTRFKHVAEVVNKLRASIAVAYANRPPPEISLTIRGVPTQYEQTGGDYKTRDINPVAKMAECTRCGRSVLQTDIYQTEVRCECGKLIRFSEQNPFYPQKSPSLRDRMHGDYYDEMERKRIAEKRNAMINLLLRKRPEQLTSDEKEFLIQQRTREMTGKTEYNPEELCKRCMRRPAGPLGICSQCRIEVVGMHDHPVVRGYFKHNPRGEGRVENNPHGMSKILSMVGAAIRNAKSFLEDGSVNLATDFANEAYGMLHTLTPLDIDRLGVVYDKLIKDLDAIISRIHDIRFQTQGRGLIPAEHNPRPSFYSKDIPEMSDKELWKFYEKTGSSWAFDALSSRGLYASAGGITEANPFPAGGYDVPTHVVSEIEDLMGTGMKDHQILQEVERVHPDLDEDDVIEAIDTARRESFSESNPTTIYPITMRRETLMQEIRKIMGEKWHLRPSEEFGTGSNGGIWTDGENIGKDGQMLANYNGPDNTGMGFWMHPRIKTLLDRAGWYLEWYDPGTIMLYPA